MSLWIRFASLWMITFMLLIVVVGSRQKVWLLTIVCSTFVEERLVVVWMPLSLVLLVESSLEDSPHRMTDEL